MTNLRMMISLRIQLKSVTSRNREILLRCRLLTQLSIWVVRQFTCTSEVGKSAMWWLSASALIPIWFGSVVAESPIIHFFLEILLEKHLMMCLLTTSYLAKRF